MWSKYCRQIRIVAIRGQARDFATGDGKGSLPEYQFNPDLATVMAEHLNKSVSAWKGEDRCRMNAIENQRARTGYQQFALSFDCGGQIEASPWSLAA